MCSLFFRCSISNEINIVVGNHCLTSCMYPFFPSTPALGRGLGTAFWALPCFPSQLLATQTLATWLTAKSLYCLLLACGLVGSVCHPYTLTLTCVKQHSIQAPQKHHLTPFPWELSHPRVRSERCRKWRLLDSCTAFLELAKASFLLSIPLHMTYLLPLHSGISATKPTFYHPSI